MACLAFPFAFSHKSPWTCMLPQASRTYRPIGLFPMSKSRGPFSCTSMCDQTLRQPAPTARQTLSNPLHSAWPCTDTSLRVCFFVAPSCTPRFLTHHQTCAYVVSYSFCTSRPVHPAALLRACRYCYSLSAHPLLASSLQPTRYTQMIFLLHAREDPSSPNTPLHPSPAPCT